MSEGWKPPTQAQVREQFFAKHGQDNYTETIDRRWRKIGRLIEKGSKIPDGSLNR